MSKCNVLWCGKYQQDWENNMHEHNYFQLIAMTSGQAKVVIEDREYNANKNQLFLLSPQIPHAIWTDVDSDEPLKLLDIKFSIEDRMLFADLRKVPECFELIDFLWFQQYFEKIVHESETRRMHYYDLINSFLEIVLIQIMREQIGDDEEEPGIVPITENLGSHRGVNVDELLMYVRANYATILSLDDLSRLAKVNKTTLISIFKESFGMTPIRYINQMRMQKAKELLTNTNLSITEIAELIGFQSIHYFSRYFRSKEDCSPLEYRVANSESKYFSF